MVPLYNLVFFICDSFARKNDNESRVLSFFLFYHIKEQLILYLPELLEHLWKFEFFKDVVCFEIQAFGVWSEFWIWRQDVVFRCIGDSLPTSNYKADWHLQASTGRLFTWQLLFFYYTSMKKVSAEAESAIENTDL